MQDQKPPGSQLYIVRYYKKSDKAWVMEYGAEKNRFRARTIEYAEARKIIDALNRVYPKAVFLYVGRKGRSIFKVGIATDVERRAQELGIEIVGVDRFFNKREALRFERKLHVLYKLQGKHVRGEWFKLDTKDVTWLSSLHKYAQWDNEFNLDEMIAEVKKKVRKEVK